MLLVSSAAAEESPAPASANADTGRMESIILSASIMLTMRFFMISSPLSVDLSGYTPKRNSRNGQKCQVEYSTKIQGNKALLRAAPAKKWCKIMGKITIRGGGMLLSHKKAVPKRPQAFRNCNTKYSFRSLCPKCNDDDRRQRRKQGGVVGAAASKTRVPPKARCGCWVPQPDSGGHSKAFYLPASSTASTAFWTWRRFSASSKISSACCSNRAVEISSPRWAGRQCSTSALGFAFSSRRPVS